MFPIITALFLLLLAVVTIVITEILKKQELWQESIWNIPSACLVAIAILLGMQILAKPPLAFAGVISDIVLGTLIGFASGGLYKMIQLFRGSK